MSEQRQSRPAKALIVTREYTLRSLRGLAPLETAPHPNRRLISETVSSPWQNAISGKPFGKGGPTRAIGTIRKYRDGKIEALHWHGTSTSDRFIVGLWAAGQQCIPARLWGWLAKLDAGYVMISRPIDDYSESELSAFLEHELDKILRQPLEPLPGHVQTLA